MRNPLAKSEKGGRPVKRSGTFKMGSAKHKPDSQSDQPRLKNKASPRGAGPGDASDAMSSPEAGNTPLSPRSSQSPSFSAKAFRQLMTPKVHGSKRKDHFGRNQSKEISSDSPGSGESPAFDQSQSSDAVRHHTAADSASCLSPKVAAIHARTMAAATSGRLESNEEYAEADSRGSVENDSPVGEQAFTLPDRPEQTRGARTPRKDPKAGADAGDKEDVALTEHWIIDHSQITLGKTIGHSSFGKVTEGRLNGTRVAVKTISRESAKNGGEDLDAFRKEAELNCKLRHPNIVLFMGIAIQPTEVCIVTELMARGNVRDLLVGPVHGKAVKLEWALRLQWALDTAQGMAYLHSLNPPMIHRDLKTTNLLVDRGMNVKICDFGLSRFQAEDKIMSAVGTVQFAAPEVLKNEKYTERADVFSYGTVLWELYTRKSVFKGMPQIQVYKAVIDGHMPGVSQECDQRYSKLMRECWSIDADTRPSFREVIDRLVPLADELDSA